MRLRAAGGAETTKILPDPVVTGGGPAGVVPVGVPGAWALKFRDEFDGTALDLTKWSSTWFGGAKQQNVTTSASNVRVSGGNLIFSMSSPTVGASVNTNPTDRAGNASKVGYQFNTGVVEARINFPGNGSQIYNWCAWWSNGQSWPNNGEHDIAEILGGRPSIHYHYSGGGPGYGSPAGYWGGAFHTYALHRKVGSADVYYDGVKVASYATHDGEAPHYLILCNGNGNGSPVVTGPASEVRVDYVRAWQPA